jgi:hypothetical protein
VADGEVAGKARQDGFVEYLGDETEILVHGDVLRVADGDARTLLSAVLEGEQAEVRETGRIDVGTHDAEDATGLARPIQDGIVEWLRPHGWECREELVSSEL